MGNNNAPAAADEARYAYNSLGNNLYALQAGNEPDIYNRFGLRPTSYGVNDYVNDWDGYFSAVKALVPQASFAGPDIASNRSWVPQFVDSKNAELKLVDAHYYITGPASDSSINYTNLLAGDFSLKGDLQDMQIESSKYGLPYRMTECNSIWGGGKAGASDAFASALWALDFMWQVAQNGGQGVNFHDGNRLIYSPLLMANGQAIAKPDYYGMLAFKYGATGGTMIPATLVNNTYNCSVYACVKANNTYSLTIINKEKDNDVSFTVQLDKNVSNVSILRLTAPSVTSLTGTTFAGSVVSADGTFTAGNPEQSQVNAKRFTVTVHAGSAAVITMN